MTKVFVEQTLGLPRSAKIWYWYKSIYTTAYSFFLFEQTPVQSTIIFLFGILDRILQTGSIVKKSAAAAMQEDMAVLDSFKWLLKMMADRDGHKG